MTSSINETSKNEILATIDLHKKILGSGSKPRFVKLGMSELSTARKVSVYAMKIFSCFTIVLAPLVFYMLNRNLKNIAHSTIEKDNRELIKLTIPEFDIADQGKMASLYATKCLIYGRHITEEQLDKIVKLSERKDVKPEEDSEEVDKKPKEGSEEVDKKPEEDSEEVDKKPKERGNLTNEDLRRILEELDEVTIEVIDESTEGSDVSAAEELDEAKTEESNGVSSFTRATQFTTNVAKSILHTANSAASGVYGGMMSTAAGTYNGVKSWFNASAGLDETQGGLDETAQEENVDETAQEEVDVDETSQEELDEVTIEVIDESTEGSDVSAAEELDEANTEESNGVSSFTRATQSTANVAKSILHTANSAASYIYGGMMSTAAGTYNGVKSWFNAPAGLDETQGELDETAQEEDVGETAQWDEVIIEDVDVDAAPGGLDEAKTEESNGGSSFTRDCPFFCVNDFNHPTLA